MDNNYRHIVLTFDQAKQPKFEEKKGKGWVEYGEDNDYPKYLLSLYNESAKHGAIVKSKSNYIYGKGFEIPGNANSKGETWNNIAKRCIKDDELYRGYFLQIIWNRAKKISEVYHIEFAKVRTSKDLSTFYVKNDWLDYKEKPRVYPAFDLNNPVGSQIYYYKEYNPSSECYPMPSYFQALNYIECDIKVSRHLLGMANQSFTGTTLINLNNGDPISEEHKGEVERSLLKKFTGDDGKRVVIMFNKSRENAAEILPLGTSTLTKEDFTNVNNLIQQEIFAAHQIVSPSLMGIKTEGQLGGRNEIREAYEIFMNTYVSERQDEISGIITKFRNLKGEQGEFKLIPLEPLKFEFNETIMAANLTQDEIRELMGKEPLQKGQVTSDGKTAQPIVQNQPVQQEANDAIKNLTGRQYQNVMRIVRQFSKGQLTKGQASLMLKSGYSLTDSDVNVFLGLDDSPFTDFEVQKFADDEEDRIINEFSLCGENSESYSVNERVALRFADITDNEAKVVKLLTDNKNLTSEAISNEINLSIDEVNSILKKLIDKEIISTKIVKVGTDSIIETKVLKPLSELGYKPGTQVFIRYTYEWKDIVPVSERDTMAHPSRKFCKAMVAMSANKEGKIGKMWSMTDIQNISMRLGYDVLTRVGGWWTMPDGEHSVSCRHEWFANTVIKK